jgi:hypothetical protein
MAWTATPSTVHGLSLLSLPPSPPLIHFSPHFFSTTQMPSRTTCVDVPAFTSKALPHLRLNTTTLLSTIEHFVLLDLPARHARSCALLSRYSLAIRRPRQRRDAPTRRGILDVATLGGRLFHTRAAEDISLAYVGDDYILCLHCGMSVLHVIAEPFPRVWHTLSVSINVLPVFSHADLLF